MAKRGYIVAGLMTALLTIGCSLPGQAPTGPGRVVVHYGSMELAPNADLALVLDVRNLLGAGYKVQQAAGSSVKTISAKVTGQNLVEPVVASVDLSQCVDGLATLNFTNLPPGPVEVVVNAVDAEGKPLAWATGRAVIRPNETAKVTLKCSSTGGNLAIDFDCPELCGDGASPSPTPTPPPVNTAPDLGGVSTINVDAQGNLYLLGRDPGTLDPARYDEHGRIVRINPATLTVEKPYVSDDFRGPNDGEFTSTGAFNVFNAFNDVMRLNTTTAPAGMTTAIDLPRGTDAHWVLTTDEQDKVIFHSFSYAVLTLLREGTAGAAPQPYYSSRFGSNAEGSSYAPKRMAYDHLGKVPVWSADIGFVTLGNLSSAPNIVLRRVEDLGGKLPAAIEGVGPTSTKFLFTVGTDKNVYIWDKTAGRAYASAATFEHYPYEIERGPDGFFYVLTGPSNNMSGGYWFSHSQYQVIKCRLVGDKLEPIQTMVNTF